MAGNTIFALATPAGKSGVAIIRISGPAAKETLVALSGLKTLTPRMAHYVALRYPNGSVIDQALALYFPAPASFTGEDVAELHIHGSLAVIRELLAHLSSFKGLRHAEPGEFTRRAFINGKMDLLQAEGLADLIRAETAAQKTQSLRQMQGELSRYYDHLRATIIRCLAHLEAYIDFPEEEIPHSVLGELAVDIVKLKATIAATLQDSKRGERVREGIHIVILGAPNAGKSSLLNALAKKDAAIVSHRAGTTRDVIEVHLDIAGFPVILADTAGLRETGDDIEEEGVRRAKARAGAADIKLVVFDGAVWPKMDKESQALLDDQSLAIINKADLLLEKPIKVAKSYQLVSAATGEGIDALLKALEERIVGFFAGETAPFVTQNRHRAQLLEARDYLNRYLPDMPLELACEELRLAAGAIGKITGKIAVDELLDVVFRQFCIGK